MDTKVTPKILNFFRLISHPTDEIYVHATYMSAGYQNSIIITPAKENNADFNLSVSPISKWCLSYAPIFYNLKASTL